MATSNAAFSFSSPLSGTRRPSTGTRSRPQSGPASLAVLGLPAFFHPRHRACRQRCLIAQQPAQRQLEVTARQPVQIQIRQQILHFMVRRVNSGSNRFANRSSTSRTRYSSSAASAYRSRSDTQAGPILSQLKEQAKGANKALILCARR